MIRFTLEFVVLMVVVSICLIIALSLLIGKLLPFLVVGGVILYVYNRSEKNKESKKCPECEVKEKVNDL